MTVGDTEAEIGLHGPDHGFCTVCGTVWPCWGARHAPPAPRIELTPRDRR